MTFAEAKRDGQRYEDPPHKRMKIGKTGANNAPEHFFRIAQWAMNRGGTFTGRELHEKFGICMSTAYRYAKAWRDIWGGKTAAIRNPTPNKVQPKPAAAPSPTKVDLSRLLE
jgi:hypothetical protein